MATAVSVPLAVLAWFVVSRFQAPPAPVQVRVAAPVPGTADTCAQLVDALPQTLGEERRRAVSGATRRAAAWGDPPIVLRCGVRPPAGARTVQTLTLDGVAWKAVPGSAGVTWSTVGRTATVQVLVPRHYDGQGALVIALSPAILGNDPPR